MPYLILDGIFSGDHKQYHSREMFVEIGQDRMNDAYSVQRVDVVLVGMVIDFVIFKHFIIIYIYIYKQYIISI